MQDFLSILIECSVSMSVLSLVYIAFIPWLSKKYETKWLYYAWLIIVMGLIIPFRPHFKSALIQMGDMSSYVHQIVLDNVVNITNNTAQIGVMHRKVPVISWYKIAGAIWIIGVFSFMVYHGLRHYRFIGMSKRWSEQVNNSEVVEEFEKIKEDMGISKHIKLQICSCISSPMMIGILSPALLLPSINLSKDELPLILKHELIHFKRKDLWYKSLVFIATAIHWFNPVVYIMAKAIAVQCEISCDEEVVKDTDMDKRQQYAETIIGIIRSQSRRQTTFSTNFYGGKEGMKNRIFSIMDTTKKRMGVVVICLVSMGTLGTGVAFAASNKIINDNGAYSVGIHLSAKEQQKDEQENKEEIAKKYSEYEKYGLTYDKITNNFYYEGKSVSFFVDKLDEKGTYNFFTRPNGDIALKAVRNSDNELMGISSVSKEEYDKWTGATEEMQTTNVSSSTSDIEVERADNTINRRATAFSKTNSNYVDKSLNDYLDYGVSYDKENTQWLFNSKPIHFLSDDGNKTYFNNSENVTKRGVSLKVVRKADGQIIKLVEITDEEIEAMDNLSDWVKTQMKK